MQELLIQQLHEYIRENNPDILWLLQQENHVTIWLKEKVSVVEPLIDELVRQIEPTSTIMERCMEELIQDLQPSKYNYLLDIVEQEFPLHYERVKQTGILLPEMINLITVCNPAFTELKFTKEKEDDPHLRYYVMGIVQEYFEQH